jgi:DNA-binding transcriptional MerR regulator
MSSERPYLSIGEVLELLKHEFPDLSISRIRAFESAGQLELERTASGYRKFYDQDIAFLRTLLGSAGGPQVASFRVSDERPTSDSADDPFDHDSPAVEFGPNGELPGEPERRHPAAFQSLRRELASQTSSASSASSESHPSITSAVKSIERRLDVAVPDVERTLDAVVPDVVVPDVVVPDVVVPVDSARSTQPAVDVHLSLVATEHLVDNPVGQQIENTVETPTRNLLAANPSGLNLSLQELVSASGVTLEIVRELEGLGLVRGQGVFSTIYYDEDALLTCKLVASFQTYGVEPRHLRMYKLAADREASFFEQVVTPQLRRRNPDARAQAIETLGELVRLGEQLRVVALRQVLRAAVDR